MKAVLVFNETPDVYLIHGDEQFITYINDRAIEAGLLQRDDDLDQLDPNVVLQIFSPLIASQQFMHAYSDNAYHTIHCDDGLIFVFEQIGAMNCVAINGDGTETEAFLHRKLLVLQRLLALLHGPVLSELRPVNPIRRERQWKFIGSLLDTWALLYADEQSFLLEAVERLQVNSSLNARCVELLERTMGRVRASIDKNVAHTLLVTHCKLLALYSSRNASEIDSSDLLLLILLVNATFPWQPNSPQSTGSSTNSSGFDPAPTTPTSVRSAGHPTPTSDSSPAGASTEDRTSTSSMEDPASACSPALDGVQSSQSSQTNQGTSCSQQPSPCVEQQSPPTYNENNTSADNSQVESDASFVDIALPDETPIENVTHHVENLVLDEDGTLISNTNDAQDLPADSARTHDHSEMFSDEFSYRKLTVFLRTKTCRYTPHTLHCVRVLPGTNLLILCEMSKTSHAATLVQCVTAIHSLHHAPKKTPAKIKPQDTLEQGIKKLSDISKKYKGTAAVEKLIQEIHVRLDQTRKAGLGATHTDRLPPRLDSALINLLDKILELFRVLFILPRKSSDKERENVLSTLMHIHEQIRSKLLDYRDYLAMKAQRNISMTTYTEDFPGLVHFIYIDRCSDLMTAPSISVISQTEGGKTDLTILVKSKVWQMVAWFQQKVAAGYTCMTVRHGDFYFSYFLWFEDGMGNPLTPPLTYRGYDGTQPGILTGNFYRYLTRELFPSTGSVRVVRCYELICVHLGLLPSQYILSHCRKLASTLWEASSHSSAPLGLL